MPHPTCVYLHTDKYGAILDFIVHRNPGGMEVSQGFEVPKWDVLPKNWAWPERVMVTTADWHLKNNQSN
jgi:hypothetical protein